VHSPDSMNDCGSVTVDAHRCVVFLFQKRGHLIVEVQSGVLIF